MIWEEAPRRSWSLGSRLCVRGTVEAFEDVYEMQYDTMDDFEAASTVR